MAEKYLKNGLPQAAIGLRLKLANGTEAITTVTHGFVELPGWMEPNDSSCCGLDLKGKRGFIEVPALETYLHSAGRNNDERNSHWKFAFRPRGLAGRVEPAGKINPRFFFIKNVLYNEQVGTIKFTYNNPSKSLPYPSGYNHDLSLITSKILPIVKSPPNVGEAVDWAPYEDALDGQPVFTCLFHVWDNATEIIEGDVASSATQEAVVIRSEYIWEKKSNHSKCIHTLEDKLRSYNGVRLVWKYTLRKEAIG